MRSVQQLLAPINGKEIYFNLFFVGHQNGKYSCVRVCASLGVQFAQDSDIHHCTCVDMMSIFYSHLLYNKCTRVKCFPIKKMHFQLNSLYVLWNIFLRIIILKIFICEVELLNVNNFLESGWFLFCFRKTTPFWQFFGARHNLTIIEKWVNFQVTPTREN